MILTLLVFTLAIGALLVSAKLFTRSAEAIAGYFQLPSFVIGIFIVGIGKQSR
jgi:Ca2+/Na+ antiporter